MKPPRFAYHDPQTVPEVIALLGKLENARLLAGGQSLMPMLNMRLAAPDHIVDLNGIAELAYIKEQGDALLIGATASSRLFSDAGEACRKLDFMEDVHVTAAYRRQLAAVLTRRALEKAHERVARN